MEIDKIIEKLNEEGYPAHKDNNLIVVRTDDPDFTMDVLQAKLESYDYHNSFELIMYGMAAELHAMQDSMSIGGRKSATSSAAKSKKATVEESADDTGSSDDGDTADGGFSLTESESGQLSFFDM